MRNGNKTTLIIMSIILIFLYINCSNITTTEDTEEIKTVLLKKMELFGKEYNVNQKIPAEFCALRGCF